MALKAAQVALLAGKRPSEILHLERLEKGELWLLEFDYQILNQLLSSEDEGKLEEMKRWKNQRPTW
jgi:hypothetical protein